MTFYERYLNGETKSVYDDIYKLGQDAFLPNNSADIEKVLTETFKRVAYNLNIIYKELCNINYVFKTDFQYNFERPLLKPLENTDSLLEKLEELVKPFGFLPLSLKMFYKIVGSCNFGWDYDVNEDFIWEYADPIQIISLDEVVSMSSDEYAFETFQEYYEDDGFISLELSADYYHKDNVSGGKGYAIKINEKPSIDGEFLYEEHDTTFINYLRICFENCGFSQITNPKHKNDYKAFFEKVKPQLKRI
nr:hypothetical protein [uncultured Flavobacterium sp.]